MREIVVVPSNEWGGEGLLGSTLRWEDWTEIPSLRVLEVFPNSLAKELGLIENVDFILGTNDETLNTLDRLEAILRNHTETSLFVYNSNTSEVRKINVNNQEKRNLGCGVGEGVFHALDKATIEKIKAEQEEQKKEEPVVVTVLQKKEANLPPPLPPPPKVETKVENKNTVLKLLPPPSIYELNSEKSGFQTNILQSKFIVQ